MVAIMGQIGKDKTNSDHDTATIEQQQLRNFFMLVSGRVVGTAVGAHRTER